MSTDANHSDAAASAEPYGKKNPFPSPVLRSFDLNQEGAEKETYHIELSLEGSGLEYTTGDALGVIPMNSPELVDELIEALGLDGDVVVPLLKEGEAPLREALIKTYDIRNLNKRFLTVWSQRSDSEELAKLVETGEKQDFEDFCWGRELIDLVQEHPAKFENEADFVSVLKKLLPRLYSIASSPNAHPGEVHLLVAIVRYHSRGRDQGGVCSTFLSDRLEGVNPGVFVHINKAFRLPEDPEVPVIMVGPGTGLAPFRAFLEEREVSGAKGENWLFFGNPYRCTDYLYQDELETWVEKGVLGRLDLAFSRDQEHKIYVQDKMLESGAELWDWLQRGAHFYVCGDASRMAKDVDAALHTIAQEHGGMSEEEAVEYFKGLKREKRYSRDVY